jgi:hypothetical protein
VEAVAGDGWLEASACRVRLAQQVRRAAHGGIGPGIGREAVPMPRLPARGHGQSPSRKVSTSRSPSIPSIRGEPWNPAASKWRRYACTAGDHGPIGRSSRSPRRPIPVVMRSSESATSPRWRVPLIGHLTST